MREQKIRKAVVYINNVKIVLEEEQYKDIVKLVDDIMMLNNTYNRLIVSTTQYWSLYENGMIRSGCCTEYRPVYTASTLLEVILYEEGLLPANAMNRHYDDVGYWRNLPNTSATTLFDAVEDSWML